MTASIKAEHILPLWSSISTSGHVSNMKSIHYVPNDTHKDARSPELKHTQMSVGSRLDQQWMVYSYDGIRYNMKEQTSAGRSNTDESWAAWVGGDRDGHSRGQRTNKITRQ